MINVPLFKQGYKSNYKMLLIFIMILSVYFALIISMFDPTLGSALEGFTKAMPGMMAMFGMISLNTTLIGFLSGYLYGFLMLVFPMIFEIILANKLIAKHVDRGSMSYLLASPNTRRKVTITQMLVLISNLIILIIFCTVLGIVCSQIMFPGELDIKKFIYLNIGIFILHFAISGLCFFASCISNETRLSLSIGAGVPTLFYLIKMLANMGGKLEDFKYATIFTLFDTEKIVNGSNEAVIMLLALALIGVAFYTASIIIFKKRDLPL